MEVGLEADGASGDFAEARDSRAAASARGVPGKEFQDGLAAAKVLLGGSSPVFRSASTRTLRLVLSETGTLRVRRAA